jgi:hypothetical protein
MREFGADLIAIGTYGNPEPSHMYRPSVTADIVNHANLPVLTLPLGYGKLFIALNFSTMVYQAEQEKVTFVLPLYFMKAEVTFTRKSADDWLTIPVAPGNGACFSISTRRFAKGFWLAQLVWSVGRDRFCSESWFEIA